MKLFDLGIRRPKQTHSTPPSTTLRRISTPENLIIPIATAPMEEIPETTPGKLLAAGEVISSNTSFTSLAPCAGTIGALTSANLTSGERVPAVEFACDQDNRGIL